MNFMEIKKKTFFYVKKKRKKNNTVLEQFRFFFGAKNKDICTKKSVMKFLEIQEKKSCKKKKVHKKNCNEFQ